MELRGDFIDGQVTCPQCSKIFFRRGQIGGQLRLVPTHGDCKGAGAMVPLEILTDEMAEIQRSDFHALNFYLST